MDEREELMMLRRLAELEAKEKSVKKQAAPQSAYDPTEGMSTTEKVLAGVGKAIVDTGRGLGQLVGAVSREEVEEARKLDAPLMKTGAGMAGNIAGNVGMVLLPGGVLKGAGQVANAARVTRAAAPALSAAGNALLVPKTIKGAAALGATTGLIQPSTSTGETVFNTALGGVASAAVPVAVRGYQAARSAAEPFYETGRQRILGRALQEVAGDSAPQAVANIRAAAAPFVGPSPEGQPIRQMMGEIVPGSIPTVGQVARNPGIAALERTAAQTDPTVANAYAQRMAQQNAARVDSLEGLAGSDGAREMFGAARDANADLLYSKAFSKGINTKQAAKLQPQIERLLENPAIQDAMPIAKRLAKFDGIDLDSPAGSLQGLHYVKKALDDILDKGKQTGIGKLEAAKIAQTKDSLLGLMDKLSPAYATARAEFQAASRPLNQMDTAAAIGEKSVNKLTGNLQPNAFANALTDKTAAKASGFGGATLDNTFDSNQLNQLLAIRDDLANSVYQQTAGRGVGSDTVQKLAYSNMLAEAGVPNWLRNLAPLQVIGNVAARGADAAYGRANRELSNRLAESLLDPQTAAQLLQMSLGNQNKLLALSRGGATAGLPLPGLINANKE